MNEASESSRTMRLDILPQVDPAVAGSVSVRRSSPPAAAPGHAAAPRPLGSADFQELLHRAYDATLLTNLDGVILDANSRATQFLGRTRPELCGLALDQVVSGWQPDLLAAVMQSLESDRFVLLQAWCARRDGALFPTEIAVIRLALAHAPQLCWFIRDVTLRRENEERLRMSHVAIQNVADGILLADMEGGLQFANQAMLRLWETPDEETLFHGNLARLFGEDAATQLLAATVRHEKGCATVATRNAAGKTLHVLVSSAPNIDRDGELIGAVLSVTDISARRRAEVRLERAMAELMRSNADLQEFAYVVSHDLQEPLRKVMQFGEMLLSHADALPEADRDSIRRMQAAAQRMSRLIRGLLSLSTVATKAVEFLPVDLNLVLREVLQDLEARVHETKATVEAGPLPEIEAEPTQMRQLLQNLVGNALKFSRPGVMPVVRISARRLPPAAEGGAERCEIEVADNGIGFEQGQAETIFGIFQRLHSRDKYEGTGIGLALCRKICERHNGAIRAAGVPGAGARFTATLPVRQPAPRAGNSTAET